MAEPLRHRQPKEAATDMFSLQPPRHIPTLPKRADKTVRCAGSFRRKQSLEPFLGFLDWAYDDAGLRKLGPDLQPRDHQVEQAKPELGVLEIQLLESVIVDHRSLDVGFATDRLGALAVRSEQADFA